MFGACRKYVFSRFDRLALLERIEIGLKPGRCPAEARRFGRAPIPQCEPSVFSCPASTVFDIENTGTKAREVRLSLYRHVELNIKTIAVYAKMDIELIIEPPCCDRDFWNRYSDSFYGNV